MATDRTLAFDILFRVERDDAWPSYAINAVLAGHGGYRPANAPFIREFVYGVVRNKLLLDYLVEKWIKGKASRLDLQTLTVLRMGVYQLLWMDSVPDYAAIGESVALAKAKARGRDGFVNAVLRNIQREDRGFRGSREESALPPHIKYSFAPWVEELLTDDYGEEKTEELMGMLSAVPELCLRVNTLKTDADTLAGELKSMGYQVRKDPDPLFDGTLFVKGEGVFSLSQYCNGYFSVQDKGSQHIVKCLGAEEGETVIDVCAAPGGKAAASAERMGDSGRVIAMDANGRRVDSIAREAGRLGLASLSAYVRDARFPDERLRGTADRVLVDAPCSGIGTARRKPEVKYRSYDGRTDGLPCLQLDILEASSGYVREGGILVYSTCTFFRRENEEVTGAFLEENKNFEVETERLLTPGTDHSDGYYVCRMRRNNCSPER
ncbi:MAG: 16S rRNA (cytosine(967)-C(5))-methyltransferase RsmB [Clostridiales Family XIII bacterium]|jgi:16S rRNA (cytosine967-C5)-methyltransferase|nr:16S rRNA (cytosine(967)-C(5))-methyltransferase RsmB [Clostridiales Family XIII bacterium]